MMGSSYIRQEPKGVALIIGAWNFPVDLTLQPLVAAVSAGCCAVIKPSEVSRHTAVLIEELICKYLDSSAVRVVQGAIPETTALLKLPWNHIFYTGNAHVGRIVLRAAAEHLCTVTLELGGKSPVIVDKSANMESAVSRVSTAKWLNAGQICVAPDYVLVHKDREQEFVDGMKRYIQKFGSDPKDSQDFSRVVHENHVHRIKALLEATQGAVVAGGMVDPEARYIAPTIVQGASLAEPLMRDEIFGPVLPVIAVGSIEEAIEKVNMVCSQPLALYVYAEDKVVQEKILMSTRSGGVGINTSLEQITNIHLPFGGVGTSGQGAYHGKAGFDEFTHQRSVLHQDTTIVKQSTLPPPPYKDSLYDLGVRLSVTGFLSEEQKRLAKAALGVAGALAASVAVRSRL